MPKPIIHDLEYETDHRTTELKGIDVSAHYLRLLENATEEDVARWARDDFELVDPLRDLLIEDPTLIDDQRVQRPWSIYSANLIVDLTESLGIEYEDPDPMELVRRWVAAARGAGFEVDETRRRATALEKEMDVVIERFDIAKTPDLMVTVLARIMALPGGLDAVMPAINQAGATHPATALRAAAEFARRAA